MAANTEVRVVRCGGSRINLQKPVFSVDSSLLLCASGDTLKVFSSSTEECVHTLHGHTDMITGLALNPSNHLQVYTCSLDGTVRLWNFNDGLLIKTFIVGYSIFSLLVSKKHENVVFATLNMDSRSERDKYQLVAVHLPKSPGHELPAGELEAVLTDISPLPQGNAFGREGEYIASVKGVKLSVYFFRKHKTNSMFLKDNIKKGTRNTFTCVCCHPTEDCIATGHEDGKIRLWRNFNQKKEYTYSTLHWHHTAVSTLAFSPEGTNLLSGGVESVLVQWRYGMDTKKDFLPRLGSKIEHISTSPDGTLYCTSHADNKIMVIQSSLKVVAVIQGLVKGEEILTELLVDPRSKALVLNGKPGHLQFYSLHQDKHLYNLDIVQQEHIHEEGLQQFEVAQAALDADGSWLATVEQRQDKDRELEIILKLWAYQEQAQSFQLNTTVSAPHEQQIHAMCFSPDRDNTLLVTTSQDGQFKAWQLCDSSNMGEAEGASWSCEFVGTYHCLLPGRCCFSADGSLLAVAFQGIVTVWSPESWELLATFCQPPGDIRDLCFGRLSCSKYLLATTSKTVLCCWNLLTCSLEWSTAVDVSLLQGDPLSENVAAFSYMNGSSHLFVFKPSEPRPLHSQKALCPARVQRAVFVPREEPLDSCTEETQWLNRSQLYFLSSDMHLMTFSTRAEEDRIAASSTQPVIDDSVAVTPFFLLLGKHRREKQESRGEQAALRVQLPQGSQTVRELLRTPAHVLPAASFICKMFVSSLLITKSSGREEDVLQKEETESVQEEDASDSEGEPDSRANVQDSETSDMEPQLQISYAQEKELRKLRLQLGHLCW